MKTQTQEHDDIAPVPYLLVDGGVITASMSEVGDYVIEQPSGRLRCYTLADADDTRPTGPIVLSDVTEAEAWQELKNYRRATKDAHGLLAFRPRLLTWPDMRPVVHRHTSVASRVRAHRAAPRRQAVAR